MKKTIREQLDTAAKKYAKQEAAGDKRVEDAYIKGAKCWQTLGAKQLKEYERDLTKAHEEVIGPVPFAIKIQIRRVARIWEKVDRLHDELDMQDSFMRMGQGSMMQMKEDLDQRLSILEKWERTLQSSITSIGLTYDATPSKIKDDKKKGVDKEKAGLTTVINSAQNDMNEIPDIE